VRLVAALLVISGCGRLHFEGSEDVLSIVAPLPEAEVEGSALVTGTCRGNTAVVVRGSLADGVSVACAAGEFAAMVVFSEGDGAKQITVSQDEAAIARTFWRVTPARVRATTVGRRGSAGPMMDCDLVLARPSELAAGDLLFGMIYADNGDAGSIATPGFQRTQLDAFSHVAFWKIAGAAEPATYTFRVVAGIAISDTCESAGVLVAFSGIADVSPVVVESEVVDLDGTVEAPGVTTPKRGILVGAWGSNGPASGFAQIGMQVAASVASLDDFANVLVAFEGVQPGETGPRTATLQVARPAAAGLFVLDGKP
jgi:hypothetical protein